MARKNPQGLHHQIESHSVSRGNDFIHFRSPSEERAPLYSLKAAFVCAGTIVQFAAEAIEGSSKDLGEARAYLEGMRAAIDGLLVNAFPPPSAKEGKEKAD